MNFEERNGWYYRHFSKLFARSQEQYAKEVSALDSLTSLSGRRIMEIGSGTGEHVFCVLKHSVKSILAVDRDPVACDLLRSRFAEDSRVEVACADGFTTGAPADRDFIFVMYSVMLQGVDTVSDLLHRTLFLHQRATSVAFEFIDCDVNQRIFAEGVPSVLYEHITDRVTITPSYRANRVILRIEGRIGADVIDHGVSLLAVSRDKVVRSLEGAGLRVALAPLDNDGRRLVCLTGKP